ncbi:HIG1 domain family member 1A, mitochondrial [Thamnophis elegans]|uniref:HIG1 domain family member 1A, mitochondrial n=1 Tax=Thamnophis elegans TaxID=35005 RepID=UPI0013775958|nr:HIG1 domain family member 1A, mitochondrial [Thamnophis elegans]
MASTSEKVFPTYDETAGSKLLRKSKEMPFVPLGLAGCLSLAAFGIYRVKNRGETKMSIHLIHTRMAAQGFVVGSIVCGVVYTMIRDYVWKPHSKSSETR